MGEIFELLDKIRLDNGASAVVKESVTKIKRAPNR